MFLVGFCSVFVIVFLVVLCFLLILSSVFLGGRV